MSHQSEHLPNPPKFPRTRRTALVVFAVIVVIIIIGAWASNSSNSDVTITGANLHYSGTACGFPPSQGIPVTDASNGQGQLKVQTNQEFYISFTLISSFLSTNCSIREVTVTTPGFGLVSVSPNLPYQLAGGSSVRVTVTMTAPNGPFRGSIDLSLVSN